jgi:hypothetical protein
MKILRIIFEPLFVVMLILSHVQLSYDFFGAWWYSAAGLVLILSLGFLAWKKDFLFMSGLNISWREMPFILLTTVGAAALSFFCLAWLSAEAGITISLNSLPSYIHNFFYIINEEIIVGALVLYFLNKKCGVQPFLSSAVLAAVAAIAHWVLYKWYFRNPGFLEITTVLTLFLVTFFKNNLIFRFSHIGYAWAFHFGWMSVMFGSLHHFTDNGRLVTDLEKFNLYLGSGLMLGISIVLALASVFIVNRAGTLSFIPLRLRKKERD